MSAEIEGIKPINLNSRLIMGSLAFCGKETVVVVIPPK